MHSASELLCKSDVIDQTGAWGCSRGLGEALESQSAIAAAVGPGAVRGALGGGPPEPQWATAASGLSAGHGVENGIQWGGGGDVYIYIYYIYVYMCCYSYQIPNI